MPLKLKSKVKSDLKKSISEDFVSQLCDHFGSISYDIRYCLGITEDGYDKLRRMLSKDKNGNQIFFEQTNFTITTSEYLSKRSDQIPSVNYVSIRFLFAKI
jgi:hypothetical protein